MIRQTTLDLCWKDIEQSISNPGIEVSTPWIGQRIGLHWRRQCTNGISPTLNSSDSRWVLFSREYDALNKVQIHSQDSVLLPRACKCRASVACLEGARRHGVGLRAAGDRQLCIDLRSVSFEIHAVLVIRGI